MTAMEPAMASCGPMRLVDQLAHGASASMSVVWAKHESVPFTYISRARAIVSASGSGCARRRFQKSATVGMSSGGVPGLHREYACLTHRSRMDRSTGVTPPSGARMSEKNATRNSDLKSTGLLPAPE